MSKKYIGGALFVVGILVVAGLLQLDVHSVTVMLLVYIALKE